MSRYLIVAHQTAASPELIDRATALARDDPGAEFALIVPMTQPQHMLVWVEGEARAIAQKQAANARDALERAGLRVLHAGVGDESPMMAIGDELRSHPGEYHGLVICTFPPGLSRWLKLDLPHLAERRFGLPVIHVVAARERAGQAAKP